MESQAKLEVAKRGQLLERDSILRQQKLKALFTGGQESETLDQVQGSRPNVLEQQLASNQSKSVNPSGSGELVAYRGQRGTGKSAKKSVLIDFDGVEEDREKDSVRLILQRYTALFRFLFDKYTAKYDLNKKRPLHVASEKVIAINDLMKLYRDHNMDHSMLTKHEF